MTRAAFLMLPVLAGMAALIWLAGCVGTVDEEAATTGLVTVIDSPAEDVAPARAPGQEMQMPDYPTGCEIVSLQNALEGFGLGLTFDEVYALFDRSEHDFVNAWWGSPYGSGGAVYPPGMVAAANRGLEGSGHSAADATGCGLDGISACLDDRGLAIAWITTDMEPPRFTGWALGKWLMYANEHCAVVYDMGDGKIFLQDPLHGDVSYPIEDFLEVWEACGSMVVTID